MTKIGGGFIFKNRKYSKDGIEQKSFSRVGLRTTLYLCGNLQRDSSGLYIPIVGCVRISFNRLSCIKGVQSFKGEQKCLGELDTYIFNRPAIASFGVFEKRRKPTIF